MEVHCQQRPSLLPLQTSEEGERTKEMILIPEAFVYCPPITSERSAYYYYLVVLDSSFCSSPFRGRLRLFVCFSSFFFSRCCLSPADSRRVEALRRIMRRDLLSLADDAASPSDETLTPKKKRFESEFAPTSTTRSTSKEITMTTLKHQPGEPHTRLRTYGARFVPNVTKTQLSV